MVVVFHYPLNDRTYWIPHLTGRSPVWLRTRLFKLLFLLNAASHILHLNCRSTVLLRVPLQPLHWLKTDEHISYLYSRSSYDAHILHLKGRTPVLACRRIFKFLLSLNAYENVSQLNCCSPTVFMCTFVRVGGVFKRMGGMRFFRTPH